MSGLRSKSIGFLSILGVLAAAATAAADLRTYSIRFFHTDPVSNHITSLAFDPRLDEPFLAGAQIVGARLIVDFTPTDGFSAADLSISLAATLQEPGAGFWLVNGGTDLGWSGPGPYSASISTTVMNGTIPENGRAVWFFDLFSGADVDPPAYSGAFGPNSRIEFDYLPLPRAIVSTTETICSTSAAEFAVRSSCGGAATYEWQCIGGPAADWTVLVPGANSVNGQLLVNAAGVGTATLVVNRGGTPWGTSPGTELMFRCVVTTPECGAVISNELAPPVASGQPPFAELGFPGTTCIGGEASFNVFPDGVPPFSFAWRKNGVVIDPLLNPTAAESTLTIGMLTAGSSGVYDCVVTDACGSIASQSVSISVCLGDFNCSGGPVTVQDIFDFLSAWFVSDARADINGQGGVTVQDIFDFLTGWFAGC